MSNKELTLEEEMDAVIDAAPAHVWTEEDIALQTNPPPRKQRRHVQRQSEIEE
jgi:hypothetical protein